MDLNEALFETYKEYWPRLREALKRVDTVQLKISYPLLMYIFPEYHEAKIKLFVVGQQTKGWGWRDAEFWGTSRWDNSVEELIKKLIKIYKGFHLGEKYYNSPFWRSSHKLFQKLNPCGPEYGFLWSNVIKVDQNQQCPASFIEEVVCNSFPILPLEIEITRPDVVVFFTGPYYDQRLMETLNGLSLAKIEGYSEKILSRIVHNELPKNSFRTYHPNWFSRSRKKYELEGVINKITKLAEI